MFLTEDDAKTKWCPQARMIFGQWRNSGVSWVQYDHNTSGNAVWRNESHDGSVKQDILRLKCIGSKCMAWRWHDRPVNEIPLVGEPGDRRGYCGAYGKPEETEASEAAR